MLSARELPLAVGQTVSATILGIKYDLSVCGWREKEFILLDLPKSSSGIFHAAAGTGVHIHFIKDGNVTTFESSVIITNTHPPAYMMIEFPVCINKLNRRQHERYRAKIPVSFDFLKVASTGTIADISLGGALIIHSRNMKIGSIIFITADITALNLKLEKQEATVQNLREVPNMGLAASGVMFINISSKNLQALKKIIEYKSGSLL